MSCYRACCDDYPQPTDPYEVAYHLKARGGHLVNTEPCPLCGCCYHLVFDVESGEKYVNLTAYECLACYATVTQVWSDEVGA